MLALTPEMMDPRGLSPRGTAARVQLGTKNHTEADTLDTASQLQEVP